MYWDWLPLLVMKKAAKEHRAAIAEQLLFTALPGPRSQQVALAALNAQQQAERQARKEQVLLKEAIAAGGLKTADDLKKFPALQAVFNRLPTAAKSGLFTTPATGGTTATTDAETRKRT